MSVAGAIVGDRARTTSYMAIESVSIDINLVQATPSFSSFNTIALTPDNVQHPAEPAIALTGNILTTLYNLGDSISCEYISLELSLFLQVKLTDSDSISCLDYLGLGTYPRGRSFLCS